MCLQGAVLVWADYTHEWSGESLQHLQVQQSVRFPQFNLSHFVWKFAIYPKYFGTQIIARDYHSNRLTSEDAEYYNLSVYYASSRIYFRTTFPESLFETSFHERNFKFCFTWYPTDITLCLWSGFISPQIRTFVEKNFHGLFSKKKDLKSGRIPSFLSWSWGQLPPQKKTFPKRLLGLLEKWSKIWRYGRSWTHV